MVIFYPQCASAPLQMSKKNILLLAAQRNSKIMTVIFATFKIPRNVIPRTIKRDKRPSEKSTTYTNPVGSQGGTAASGCAAACGCGSLWTGTRIF